MRADRGAASIIAIGMLTALVALGLTLAASLAEAATRTHAQHVADVAALAAAHQARDLRALGQRDPQRVCAHAEQVVVRNGLTLADCAVAASGTVTLTVRAASPLSSVQVRSAAGTSPSA